MRLPFMTVHCRQKSDRVSQYHQGLPKQDICKLPRRNSYQKLRYAWHCKDGHDPIYTKPRDFFAYKPIPQTIMQLAESRAGEKINTRSVAVSFAIGLFGSFYETLLCLAHPRKFFADIKTVAHTFLTRKSSRTPAEIFLANGLISDVFGWVGSTVIGTIGASYGVGLAVAGMLLGDAFFSLIGSHAAWFSTCFHIWANSHQKEKPGGKFAAALDLEKQILHLTSRNLAIALAFIAGSAIAMGAVGMAFGAGIMVVVSRVLDIPSAIAYRAATVGPNKKLIELVESKLQICKKSENMPISSQGPAQLHP